MFWREFEWNFLIIIVSNLFFLFISNRFVAPKAASVFSGDGSTTAFTLDHAVGSDEDILVSVDGVIQEPSVAYAVSNGTTLTFTAAPSSNSGNNIFVYYLFRTVGTVGHPSNNALTATNGTFTGDLTVDTNTLIVDSTNNSVGIGASPDSNRDLHIKRTGANASILIEETSANTFGQFIELKDSSTSWFLANRYATSNTGNTGFGIGTSNSGDMLQIDTNGAVVMPSQPCFSVKKGSAQNNIAAGGAAQTITFDTEIFDQGSDFASNTFTAPITGRYKIQYTITVVQMDLDASEMNFRLASSNRNYSNALSPTPFDADSGNYPIVGTYMVDMDANDTVKLELVYDGGSQLDVAADSYFSGFLVA